MKKQKTDERGVRDSSVGTATDYGLERQGFWLRYPSEELNFIFSAVFRLPQEYHQMSTAIKAAGA
jgi:hypothetical protein